MLYPALNDLTNQVRSKYLIATTAAKRARELEDKPENTLLDNYKSVKTVGKALEEIAGGNVYPDGVGDHK
ncbi:DNA-directed RNA polymerase subunit omega [Staphylococcus sp. SQ8-PEA]|uniref:DNA-directed RNA polymerase subunit omega n=1 Tax=Staphylococcus marylandisciuri TaxID=2981529 RepID=A0ABT2QP35_9STAP|nr:DNA-directed RNA polymerase subunit omega [Staphylococcus marylandisciuri]MCU5745743.1 DNA-directed RNA polymerase subunit omega [Staphylococcus marylandisciuri]